VSAGLLATAIGAASFLASDHVRATRASAAEPHGERIIHTTSPHGVFAPSTTHVASPSAAPKPVWTAQARPAPVVTQPASTYDTPDDSSAADSSAADSSAADSSAPDLSAPDSSTAATTTTSAAPDPATQGRPAFVKPAEGVLSSGFGARSGGFHYGIDIANRMGTPERAVANGVVIQAGPATGFGLWVRLRLNDGTVVVYGHMDRILVRQGQRVAAGQQIATMGMRGQATGPHLHFEVWLNGSRGHRVNPLPWLAARGIRI
jgi:murein DD-endopeptidase MepM/ murein hydrolase activator NlpD